MIDRSTLLADASFAFLGPMLEIATAEQVLHRAAEAVAECRLVSIRITRLKPGRRCLIEYDLESSTRLHTLIAKVRPKGADDATFALMNDLQRVGFTDDAQNGVSVPTPVAVVHEYRLWLQEKVTGAAGVDALLSSRGTDIASRIADAIGKLHNSPLVLRKQHSTRIELSILKQQLTGSKRFDNTNRIRRLLEQCCTLGRDLPDSLSRPIHRDFYPDQVIVAGRQIYLLDFDLASVGDPALDAGNFVGHLLELSIRRPHLTDQLKMVEEAFLRRFAAITPGSDDRTIQTYATLTLARHVAISQRIPERRAFSERILALCESRFKSNVRSKCAVSFR